LPLTKGGTAHEKVLTMFEQMQEAATPPDLMAVGAIFASFSPALLESKHSFFSRRFPLLSLLLGGWLLWSSRGWYSAVADEESSDNRDSGQDDTEAESILHC
jgi:hypothetical protein